MELAIPATIASVVIFGMFWIYRYITSRPRTQQAVLHAPQSATAHAGAGGGQGQPFCLSKWIEENPLKTTLIAIATCIALEACFYWLPWGYGVALLVVLWIAAEFGADEETLPKVRHLLLATAAVGIIVLQINKWWDDYKAEEALNKESHCTTEHHCQTVYEHTGTSSDVVSVPKTKKVCFDAWLWSELETLKFTTFQKGSEQGKLYPCSKDQVMNGTCHAMLFDRFQFNPKEKIDLPNYWFVRNDEQCQ
jgi:hypothetical protein